MSIFECFFWLDGEEGAQVIRPMCLRCHYEKFRDVGWYYHGPLGRWEYKCEKCGDTIKKADESLPEPK